MFLKGEILIWSVCEEQSVVSVLETFGNNWLLIIFNSSSFQISQLRTAPNNQP